MGIAAAAPALVATPARFSVRRGEAGAFDVKLSEQPAANVAVGVARTSGNWNAAQKTTVTAGTTASGSPVFTVTAPALRRPR